MLTSLAVVTVAVLLPFTPLGSHFGLVAPPPRFYLLLGIMVLVYLTIVELVKRLFYRRWQRAAPSDRVLPRQSM